MPPAVISKMPTIIDYFTDIKWKINEDMAPSHNPNASGKVDGVHVLGRMVGVGFLVNGISKNGRLYQAEVWEKQKVLRQPELDSGGMFGAFGHEQIIDALALGEGKSSHLTTDFWIEDGQGMIEILILGTPTGQNLNHYMRAGKQMAVSSRAVGAIKETTKDGIEIVDPDAFYLFGWDIVIDGGVDSALPPLVESILISTKETVETTPIVEDKQMDEATKQIISLNEDKAKANAKLEILEANHTATKSENDALKAKVALYEATVGTPDNAKEISEGIVKWLAIEPFKSYAQKLGLYQNPELKKLVANITPVMESFAGINSETYKADIALLEEYKAIGKPQDLKVVSEQATAYAKVGKLDSVKKLVESLAKVKTAVRSKRREKLINESVIALHKAFPKVEEAMIKNLVSTQKPADAVKTIKMLHEAAVKSGTPDTSETATKNSKKIEEQRAIDPLAPVLVTSIKRIDENAPNEPLSLSKRLTQGMLVTPNTSHQASKQA